MAYIDTSPPSLGMDSGFAAQVREAFSIAIDSRALGYQPLGHHPLAQSALARAGLVVDVDSPTLEEQGRALYHALWWATERLAPDGALVAPVQGAAGSAPAIVRETSWARYNLLRYLYLQPIGVAADEQTLAALGIASPELFYEERSRAFAEATQWLQRQRDQQIGDERIRTLALDGCHLRLQENKAALHLLGIASIFQGAVPAKTLVRLAAGESVGDPETALNWLLARRFLHSRMDGAAVEMAEPLRLFIAQRQPRVLQQARNQAAATLASEAGDAAASAWHLIEGGSPQQAVRLLLDPASALRGRQEVVAALTRRFTAGEVGAEEWRALQMLRAESAQDLGLPEEAMAIWRDLLKGARTSQEQAELYLRMGRLVAARGAGRSDEHALAIFQMGLDRLVIDDAAAKGARAGSGMADGAPALLRAELLKEMAWVQIQLQHWREADEALRQALGLLSSNERVLRAELYDALSTLRRNQNAYADAIEHAQAALALREGMGDSMRLGRSYNSLGILYRITEEFDNAIQAYQKALAIFQRLDNAALVATTLLNIGTAYHFTERLDEAQRWYRRCLLLADEAGLPVTEVRAHANLFEALNAQGRNDEARLHWRSAWARSQQQGFTDEIAYLQQVAERDPILMRELGEDLRLQPAGDAGTERGARDDAEDAQLAGAEEGLVATFDAEAGRTVGAEPNVQIDAWMASQRIVQEGAGVAEAIAGATGSAVTEAVARAAGVAAGVAGGVAAGVTAGAAASSQGATSARLQFGAAMDVGEARLLALLERLDSINVATAMEATGASKATATRKLAHLVEQGLLVRHGQGRATYYTRAHGIPAVVMTGDLTGLQNRLDMVALRFAEDYNLVRARAVGVRYGFRPDGEAEVCYEVRASFTRNPVLDDFFALERALTRATGSRIQLTM